MVYLSLSDADENPLSLTFDSNTNPALIPNASIMVAGKENIRAISLMAKFMKSGTATLTFNLSDGTVTIPFTITVKVGTARNETLNGTEGADMIFGLNGKDIINGFGGNDLLCGENGIDTIGGGDGNDFIDGQNGDDLLAGGNDNDILLGRFGNDVLTGGSGFDFFSGGAGVDTATDFNAGEGDTQTGTIP
jgi:Ca2+-binding RTX toxin-like protein